jgi:hypothetical protein
MTIDYDADLGEMATAKRQYEAVMKAKGKSAITAAVTRFLDAHPKAEAVRWTQYTPHFNDGDACTFSVNEPSVKLGGDEDGDEDGFYYGYSLTYENSDPERKTMKRDLDGLHSALSEIEDAVQLAFGDGYLITATRAGVEVEEYDHD